MVKVSSHPYPGAVEIARQPARETTKVKAVHDNDLVAYIRSLGLDPESTLGRCKFCGADVTLDNLAALFPQSGSIKFVCPRRECLAGVQELIREGVVRL